MEESLDIEGIAIKLESSFPICRICLDVSMEYIEFEAPLCLVNNQEITYSQGFHEISPAVGELPDKLPTSFCVSCGKDLLNAYLFIKRMENANFLLNKVKCLSEEKYVDFKDEVFLDEEQNEAVTENLEVEVFPSLYGNEDDDKPESQHSITFGSREELQGVEGSHQVSQNASPQQDDVISWSDSPYPMLIDAELESGNENALISEEEVIWVCDQCGMKCDSCEALTEHQEMHKGNENLDAVLCSKCDAAFRTNDELENHSLFHEYSKVIDTDTSKVLYQCILCEKRTRTEATFIDHIHLHRGTKPHACKICSRTFTTKYRLKLHNMRVHGIRDSKLVQRKDCEKCLHCQRFVKKSHMKAHMQTHSPTNELTCHICGKQLSTANRLKAHLVRHEDGQFTCHICEKVCQSELALNKHTHYIHNSDRKKYQCEDCGLVFQYPSNLKDHQRKHNQKNRFHCPHCERSYCRKTQLDVHMRYHNKDFRYKCDQCDKCYVTKSNLTDHIRACHTKITFDCDKCDQKFKSATGLRKHKYSHSGYPYACPLCGVGQTSRSGMKSHMFNVHKDAITEEEFDSLFPIIIPKSGYRRPKD